jgi:hypothetical protein
MASVNPSNVEKSGSEVIVAAAIALERPADDFEGMELWDRHA